MSEIKIGIRDKPPFTWTLPNEERHVFRICRFRADILEMEDLHFHLDSAVMLPERDPADADDPSSGAPLTGLSGVARLLGARQGESFEEDVGHWPH